MKESQAIEQQHAGHQHRRVPYEHTDPSNGGCWLNGLMSCRVVAIKAEPALYPVGQQTQTTATTMIKKAAVVSVRM